MVRWLCWFLLLESEAVVAAHLPPRRRSLAYSYYSTPKGVATTTVADDDFTRTYGGGGEEKTSWYSWFQSSSKQRNPATDVPTPSQSSATFRAPTPYRTTASPTLGPTRSCQDNPYYLNPINGQPCDKTLQQEQDCLWSVFLLGMTAAQQDDLLANCPYSCQVCDDDSTDTAVYFEIATTVRLVSSSSSSSSFLGGDAVAAMEGATTEYLSRYLRSRQVRAAVLSTVIVAEALELSADDDNAAVNYQQQNSSLDVSMVLKGVSYSTASLDTYIRQGLLNTSYKTALSYTGDNSFLDVYISVQQTSSSSSAGQQQRSNTGGQGRQKHKDQPHHHPRLTQLPIAVPVLAISSAVFMAATGYILKILVGLRDARRQEKGNSGNGGSDSTSIVTEVIHVEEEEDPSSYMSFNDDEDAHHHHRTMTTTSRTHSSRYNMPHDIQQQQTGATFDSYLDWRDDDDGSFADRQRSTTTSSIPEVTFVDSSMLDDHDGMMMMENGAISTSLQQMVSRVGVELDVALDDFAAAYQQRSVGASHMHGYGADRGARHKRKIERECA